MNKKYVTIGLLFVLLVSFSSSQSQPVVGHPASEVTPGSFQVGDYILPAGSKIGIGTTTPGAKLEVLGTGQQLRLRYDANIYVSLQTTSTNNLDFYTAANQRGSFANGRWMAWEYGTSNLPSFTGLTDADTGLALWNSNKLSLMTGGSHRMTVDSSGNVGVGTTNPTEKLDVSGSVKASSLSGSGNAYVCADSSGKLYRSASPCV